MFSKTHFINPLGSQTKVTSEFISGVPILANVLILATSKIAGKVKQKIRVNESVKFYIFNILFSAFFSIYELRTHTKNVHCPPVNCTICLKIFSSPNTLKSHMKLSHSEKHIPCQVSIFWKLNYKSVIKI